MEKRILVVGCGGLGCELAKLLAMSSENKVTFIDDDTIDATNLNRQFFFSTEDIGKSKSQVVSEKTRLGNHICGRIEHYKKLEFYKQFDVVYNCLDNDTARTFVNERCHASETKMVDGGSAGWLGQAFCNGKECFDCQPKRIEKVYPICTVRDRPQNFNHCLVWAKTIVEGKMKDLLSEELNTQFLIDFNPISSEIDNTLADNEPVEFVKRIKVMKSYLNDSINSDDSDLEILDDKNFQFVITDAIEISSEITSNDMNDNFNDRNTNSNVAHTPSEIQDLYERLNNASVNDVSLIYEIAVIKARRFSIIPMNLLDAQTFINNIIPSVCTTNAIIASLMILSAAQMKNFYLVQGSMNILRTELNEKNKNCIVCSLPLYSVKYNNSHNVKDFLVYFKAESLISDTTMFTTHEQRSSECLLSVFEGNFLIAVKNDMNNRVYFEGQGGTLQIKRIK